jgi:diguanylate cyclase (GGDEF)-like protein
MSVHLDDVWLEKMGGLKGFSLTEKRRLYRIIIVCGVGISYLIDTLMLTLFHAAGTIESEVVFFYGTAACIHVLLFSTLHWSGLSERLTNPHMTVYQMAYAIIVQMVGLLIAPQIFPFFLGLLFVIFPFAALRITLREAMIAWFFTCLAIAAVFALSGRPTLGITDPSELELILILISFALILLRSIALSYYATALRMKMYRMTHSLEEAVQQAERLATYDPLTGVLNRRAILPAIDEQINICRRKGLAACVAMLDLDNFKIINDTLGHAAGDIVLKELAQLIEDQIREFDKLGRYGGEEFVLLLPATRLDEGMSMLERIRREIAATRWHQLVGDLQVTISCGITEISPSDTTTDTLSRADHALYDAKHAGRNLVSSFALQTG